MIYHKHHIIPKHMGGTDDPSNIVELTIEEHAEAHKVLYEKYGKIEDKLAWNGLAGLIGKDQILLEIAKANGKKISLAKKGCVTWNKGKKTGPLSEAHKMRISKSGMGIKKPTSGTKKGHVKSQQHKSALAKASLGKRRYNNGKDNKLFIPGKQPTDFVTGWI